MKLSKQNSGQNVWIGIEGTTEEINNYYQSCFNRGATDQKLHKETDNFAWFATNQKKFKKGLTNIELNKICRFLDMKLGRDKDPKKELTDEAPFLALASARAQEIYNSIPKVKSLKGSVKGQRMEEFILGKLEH